MHSSSRRRSACLPRPAITSWVMKWRLRIWTSCPISGKAWSIVVPLLCTRHFSVGQQLSYLKIHQRGAKPWPEELPQLVPDYEIRDKLHFDPHNLKSRIASLWLHSALQEYGNQESRLFSEWRSGQLKGLPTSQEGRSVRQISDSLSCWRGFQPFPATHTSLNTRAMGGDFEVRFMWDQRMCESSPDCSVVSSKQVKHR